MKPHEDIDDVAIERVLSGRNMPLNRAERVEAVRRWRASGRPLNQLAKMPGWKVDRYTTKEKASSATD